MEKAVSLLLILLIISSCGEDIEGCLDPEASNFDPSADVTCCCEYPQLSIRMTYNNYAGDSAAFSSDDIFSDEDGTPFYVNNISMYLSDFELIRLDNSVETIVDTLTVSLTDGTTAVLKNDVLLLQDNVFQYNIGTTNTSGNFIKIRFKVGLDNDWSQVNPESVESTHPLSASNGLYENDTYIFNQIEVISDTSLVEDATSFNVISNVVNIELEHDFSINSGFDTQININADLKRLLEDIDFQNDDFDTIIATITVNSSNIFTIVQ